MIESKNRITIPLKTAVYGRTDGPGSTGRQTSSGPASPSLLSHLRGSSSDRDDNATRPTLCDNVPRRGDNTSQRPGRVAVIVNVSRTETHGIEIRNVTLIVPPQSRSHAAAICCSSRYDINIARGWPAPPRRLTFPAVRPPARVRLLRVNNESATGPTPSADFHVKRRDLRVLRVRRFFPSVMTWSFDRHYRNSASRRTLSAPLGKPSSSTGPPLCAPALPPPPVVRLERDACMYTGTLPSYYWPPRRHDGQHERIRLRVRPPRIGFGVHLRSVLVWIVSIPNWLAPL